ncbi:unnamed protein product [Boreogadus saida]
MAEASNGGRDQVNLQYTVGVEQQDNSQGNPTSLGPSADMSCSTNVQHLDDPHGHNGGPVVWFEVATGAAESIR